MTRNHIYRNTRQRIGMTLALLGGFISPAFAAGSDMPWEEPLLAILDSIQGPVVQVVAILVIAITGLTLAFGDSSGGFRKLIQIVFGISIAFAATTLVMDFFGFTGGAVIA